MSPYKRRGDGCATAVIFAAFAFVLGICAVLVFLLWQDWGRLF